MPELLSVYVVRLLVALVVGGLVGLEREFHGKPAGIRTNMLMCIGSCLIMIISIEIARTAESIADPGRIAAQVVTGVGFLCAGTIMRSRFSVSGLTTAATIWVLSALGLAIGAGYIVLSLIGAALITITLVLVRYLETVLNRFNSTHIIQLVMVNSPEIIGKATLELSNSEIRAEIHEVRLIAENWSVTLEYVTSKKKHSAAVKALSGLEGVLSVTECA